MSDEKHTRQVYQLFDTPLYLKFIVWRSIIDYIANHSVNSDFLLYIFVEYLGNSLCQVSSISLMLHLTSLSPKLYVELKKDYFTLQYFFRPSDMNKIKLVFVSTFALKLAQKVFSAKWSHFQCGLWQYMTIFQLLTESNYYILVFPNWPGFFFSSSFASSTDLFFSVILTAEQVDILFKELLLKC